MFLTVLGRHGPYPRPGGACSGYLIEDGATRVLVDCGSGVLSRLLGILRPEELDAIVLSHLHFDHCSDLFVMRYALDQQERSRRGARSVRVPLYTPAEPFETRSRRSRPNAHSLRRIPSKAAMRSRLGLFTSHLCRWHTLFRQTACASQPKTARRSSSRETPNHIPAWSGGRWARMRCSRTHAL